MVVNFNFTATVPATGSDIQNITFVPITVINFTEFVLTRVENILRIHDILQIRIYADVGRQVYNFNIHHLQLTRIYRVKVLQIEVIILSWIFYLRHRQLVLSEDTKLTPRNHSYIVHNVPTRINQKILISKQIDLIVQRTHSRISTTVDKHVVVSTLVD
jgi:hypothetical protein